MHARLTDTATVVILGLQALGAYTSTRVAYHGLAESFPKELPSVLKPNVRDAFTIKPFCKYADDTDVDEEADQQCHA